MILLNSFKSNHSFLGYLNLGISWGATEVGVKDEKGCEVTTDKGLDEGRFSLRFSRARERKEMTLVLSIVKESFLFPIHNFK